MINIVQIQCFCAVVKYGSISQAAEALFMSQSAVSKHMAALEKECGFPLIVRKRRAGQVDLSLEGQLMLRDCNKILNNYDDLIHLCNEMRKKPLVSEMTFSLIGIPEMAHYGIVSSVNRFCSGNSNFAIHLIEGDEFYGRLALINNEADIAFTSDIRLDRLQYNWQNYCTETLSIVVSQHSHLAKMDKIYMSQLKDLPLIAGPKKTNLFEFCLNACQGAGFEPRFVFLSSRLSIALDYIAKHPEVVFISATQMLEPICNTPACDNCKVLHIENSPTFNYAIVWKKGKILNDTIKQYLRFVAPPASEIFINEHRESRFQAIE